MWFQPLKAWDINVFCFSLLPLTVAFPPCLVVFDNVKGGEKTMLLCDYICEMKFFLFKFQVWFVLECWLLNIDLWMLNLQNLLLLIWFWFGINDFGCLVAYFLYLIFMDSWIFGAYDFFFEHYWVLVVGCWGFCTICGV